MEAFSKVCGFYLHYADEKVKSPVRHMFVFVYECRAPMAPNMFLFMCGCLRVCLHLSIMAGGAVAVRKKTDFARHDQARLPVHLLSGYEACAC